MYSPRYFHSRGAGDKCNIVKMHFHIVSARHWVSANGTVQKPSSEPVNTDMARVAPNLLSAIGLDSLRCE